MENKAVVLGCNYYIGLSVIRCLGRNGVHVVACDYNFKDVYGAKSKYVKEKLLIKTLNKCDKEAFDELILYGKKQESKPVLLPTHDKFVEFIDKYYYELSKYYLISQSSSGINSIVLDKWKLYDLAKKHGVRFPLVVDVDDINFYEKCKNIPYPCIIKPTDTIAFTKVFNKKVFICNNNEQLLASIEKCKKNNIKVFAQEIIPGFDDHMLTYDFYVNRDGITTHYMTAQKYRQWPINFGASVFTGQKYIKEVVDIGKPFIEAIGYRGFGEIEFKRHEKTGEIYLIEINARTTNFNNLIYKVGLNMPYIAYKELTGELITKKYIQHNTNYAFIYAKEDLAALLKYSKTGQMSFIKGFLKIFTKKLAPAIFSVDDMKPWINYNINFIKRKMHR